MECSVEGCIRGVFAKGLCHPHYDQDRASRLGPCTVDGCEKPQHSHGLCGAHYRKAKVKTAEPCSVEGCQRGVVANGLCSSHNQRQRRRGSLDPSRPLDWGARASHPLYDTWNWQRRHRGQKGVHPEWEDFWQFVTSVGERPSPSHRLHRIDEGLPIGPANFEWREQLISVAVKGSQTAEYRRLYQQERRAKNPEYHRNIMFGRRYGITYSDYQELLKAQRGNCAICNKPETSLNQHTHEPRLLSVDHCHQTGRVRGLLCKRCNTGIGAFEESPDLLKAAIRYVRRHKTLSDES